MGILEAVTNSLSSTEDGASTQQSSLLTSICQLINSPQIGGVQGLMDKFKAAGLGQMADSWVARGPNPAVSASQLKEAVPQDQLRDFARQLGMDEDGATQHLADALPQVVDNLTPEGKLPANDMDPAAMLALLKKQFFG